MEAVARFTRASQTIASDGKSLLGQIDLLFRRQAEWTQQSRNLLYRRAGLFRARLVLDLGCGTGVLTGEMASRCRGQVLGVDLDRSRLGYAAANATGPCYLAADANSLPFGDGAFDLVHLHFVLLWLADPAQAVLEMKRVCRPGGWIVVAGEPDYGGWIDFPPEIALGRRQAAELRRQGADPEIGRKLRSLFAGAGLDLELGVLPSVWTLQRYEGELEAEWAKAGTLSAAIAAEQQLDRAAVASGTRLVFSPIFQGLARREPAS